MRAAILFILLAEGAGVFGQSRKIDELIRSGNEYYRKEQFVQAAEAYNKVLVAEPGNIIAKFNQGNAFYKQDQKVEAAKLYSGIIQNTEKKDMLAMAFYNKGVVLSNQKNLEESIEAYKNALRNDPGDKEARENLQKALLELKKKPPPPKKEDEKKKNNKQQQQKQPQSRMNPRDAQQRLQLLQQKEKEVQQRIQKEKNKMGGSQPKDW